MKRLMLLLLFFSSVATTFGQKRLPLYLSFSDNQTRLTPAPFSARFHPGITIGIDHLYQHRPHHEWFQTLRLGYFYHQFSEHALQLYTEAGYRHIWNSGIDIAGLLGAGYLHAFPDLQQFTFVDGSYERKRNFGRPQLMATAALSLGYNLEGWPVRLFLKYQFWLQMPFVNKYVPILPNTALHLGMVYQLPLRTNGS